MSQSFTEAADDYILSQRRERHFNSFFKPLRYIGCLLSVSHKLLFAAVEASLQVYLHPGLKKDTFFFSDFFFFFPCNFSRLPFESAPPVSGRTQSVRVERRDCCRHGGVARLASVRWAAAKINRGDGWARVPVGFAAQLEACHPPGEALLLASVVISAH